jgi:hypothetical protein
MGRSSPAMTGSFGMTLRQVKPGVERVPARTGDIEQKETADNADVFIEIDRGCVAGSALHRPEWMSDERGPEGVERHQESKWTCSDAEHNCERHEDLNYDGHKRGDGRERKAGLRHVVGGSRVVGELVPAEDEEERNEQNAGDKDGFIPESLEQRM